MQNIIEKAVLPIETEAYEILRAIQAYEYSVSKPVFFCARCLKIEVHPLRDFRPEGRSHVCSPLQGSYAQTFRLGLLLTVTGFNGRKFNGNVVFCQASSPSAGLASVSKGTYHA